MNYPDEWLCERCCRPYFKHLKRGEQSNIGTQNTADWCFNEAEVEGTQKYSWFFIPMDNLTYIENKANEKYSN